MRNDSLVAHPPTPRKQALGLHSAPECEVWAVCPKMFDIGQLGPKYKTTMFGFVDLCAHGILTVAWRTSFRERMQGCSDVSFWEYFRVFPKDACAIARKMSRDAPLMPSTMDRVDMACATTKKTPPFWAAFMIPFALRWLARFHAHTRMLTWTDTLGSHVIAHNTIYRGLCIVYSAPKAHMCDYELRVLYMLPSMSEPAYISIRVKREQEQITLVQHDKPDSSNYTHISIRDVQFMLASQPPRLALVQYALSLQSKIDTAVALLRIDAGTDPSSPPPLHTEKATALYALEQHWYRSKPRYPFISTT